MSSIAVLVNPAAGGGRGKKVWRVLQPQLVNLFNTITYRLSASVTELKPLTRELLSDNPDYLLIIGGDGTLSHAINGLVINDKLTTNGARIAYLNSGCGGDFIRQFAPQNIKEFLERLMQNKSIQSNIGKMTCAWQKQDYFINIASCGLSAYVAFRASKSWLKKLGGINYFINSLIGLINYRKVPVRIQFDNNQPFECSLLLIAICNGQYFGGKMHVAPEAKLNDNLLDVITFHDFSPWSALRKLIKIYSGSHLLEKNVHNTQAKTIEIHTDKTTIFIEADGEQIGCLPARFELLEEKLALIV